MKVLVVTASKHGATKEIGAVIADELRKEGFDASSVEPGDVTSLDGVDAVVLGSAVYMTQWMESARNFISHYGDQLRTMPLWAFSSGLSGVPVGNVQDPRRIGPTLLSINPIDHQVFKGRMEMPELALRERSVARLGNAPEGDFREWERIRTWAQQIAADLREHLPER